MNYKWHIFLALLFGFFVAFYFQLNWLLVIPICVFFGTLADIDSKNAFITWLLLFFAVILLCYGLFFEQFALIPLKNASYYALFLLTTVLLSSIVFPHRGFTHSIVFSLIVCFPILFVLNYQYFFVAFSAFYSHLLFDGLFFKVV